MEGCVRIGDGQLRCCTKGTTVPVVQTADLRRHTLCPSIFRMREVANSEAAGYLVEFVTSRDKREHFFRHCPSSRTPGGGRTGTVLAPYCDTGNLQKNAV